MKNKSAAPIKIKNYFWMCPDSTERTLLLEHKSENTLIFFFLFFSHLSLYFIPFAIPFEIVLLYKNVTSI